MSRMDFLNNAIDGLSKKCVKAIAIRETDLPLINLILSSRMDKKSFQVTNSFGRFMLRFAEQNKGVSYAKNR